MSDLDQMKRDMEAGTPGPWEAESAGRDGYWVSCPTAPYVVAGTEDECGRYGSINNETNARRIARVPDMEATILAQAATIEALKDAHAEQERYLHEAEALRARLAKADELADQVQVFYEYSGVSVDVSEALAAYRAAPTDTGAA